MLTLRLTDGTTTVTLSGDGGVLLQASYVPQPGEPGSTLVEDAVVIAEGTAAQIQTNVREINQLFKSARRLSGSNRTDRVYVEYQHEGDSATWRAVVRDGHLSWPDEPIRRRFSASAALPAQLFVSWERESEWEGPEAALTWGASGTSTITINNGDTGSNYNAALVEADSIEGELPAPVKLVITNDSGVSLAWRNFFITNDGVNGFTAAQHQIGLNEAETWGADNHTAVLWDAVLSTDQISKCAGEDFRILAAFTTSSINIHYKASLYQKIGGVYQLLVEGPEILNTKAVTAFKLLDLGSLPIPANGQDAATGNLSIVISARNSSSVSATLDFIQMLRADDFCRLEQMGFSLADGAAVVVDDLTGIVYALSGSTRYNIVDRRGAQLVVVPGQTNRFVVSFDETSGAYVPARQVVVSGTYRPRRLTL